MLRNASLTYCSDLASSSIDKGKKIFSSNQKANDVPPDMWDKAKQAAVTVVNLSKNQLMELPSKWVLNAKNKTFL